MIAMGRIVGLTFTLVASGTAASTKSLRFEAPPLEPNVVQPLSFEQQLLVCNAYAGGSPMSLKQNGHGPQAADQRDIKFQECRQISSRVRSKDKLDFVFGNSAIQASFQIGELPDNDALLLLVVEKRDNVSPLVSFKSFAFPSHADGKNAQLAVIDTFKGKSSRPHLRMEDHVNSKEKKTISKRVEQLSFNRIYAIEEGNYEASIADHALDDEVAHGAKNEKTTFHLAKRHNYVILRTGDGNLHQSLVVYPNLPKSAAGPLSVGLAAALLVTISTFIL